MTSVPAAHAVATGAQPAAWATHEADRATLDQAHLGELLEAPGDAREHRARGHRPHHDVRRPPAQRLGDLERQGLGALGVERAQVDVDEAPAGLVGHLEAQPVDVVVRSLDRDDRRPVRQGMVHLGRFEVGRDEDVGRQSERGRRGSRCSGEVPGRRAGQRFHPELHRPSRRHRDRPILEAERRVAGVVLDPQPVEAEGRRQPIGRQERCRPDRQAREPAVRQPGSSSAYRQMPGARAAIEARVRVRPTTS